MSKINIIILIILFINYSMLFSDESLNQPLNFIPMYGGDKISKEQKESNDKFVKDVIKDLGSRKNALEFALKRAWEYYYKEDLATSMMRFNQAWLLDPNNAEVFWGFGIILGDKNNMKDSVKYLEKALSFDPNNNKIMVDLAFAYTKSTYYIKMDEKEKNNILNEAIEYYEKAEKIDDKYYVLYNNWAVTLMILEKYQEALDKLNYLKSIGLKPNPDFVKNLEEKIRE